MAWVLLVAPATALGSLTTVTTLTTSGTTLTSTSLLTAPTAPTATNPLAAAPTATSATTTDSGILDPTLGSPTVTLSLGPSVEYVVGYDSTLPSALLASLGATVLDSDPDLGFAVVSTQDPSLLQALDGVAFVYVVPNGQTRLAGAQWDASQWDASQWDASQWDASQWDGAQWDGAQWDASQWDGAQWDASQWDASQWDGAQWDGAQWDGAPSMDPGFGAQWGLGAMHAPDAWNVTMGYHARTICVVDSGVDATHPDLARNVKRLADGSFGYDFVNKDKDPSDDGGHGTHVAGIAAAVTGNGHGVAGVSQSWILAAKVLDASGSGNEAALAKGIKWCADNGANVVLLALHTEQDNPAVHDAIRWARNKGLLVIAAAGNAGARCPTCVAYPARYAEAVAVGASLPDSSVAGFSNGGQDLDFAAPGFRIAGPIPGGYAIGSGTSQAAANAAGAAALVWAAKPTMKADDVRRAIVAGARDDGQTGYDFVYGWGHLRLDRTFTQLGLI